jgi:hypothetical protein
LFAHIAPPSNSERPGVRAAQLGELSDFEPHVDATAIETN